MGRPQRLHNSDAQNRRADDGDNAVEQGSGQLRHDQRPALHRLGKALDHHAIIEKHLGRIDQHISHCRAGRRDHLGTISLFGITEHIVEHQSGHQTIHALGAQGNRRFGRKGGVGRVVERGPAARRHKPPVGPQQNAGQRAENVRQRKAGHAPQGDGDRHPQIVPHEDNGGHNGRGAELQQRLMIFRLLHSICPPPSHLLDSSV